MTTLSQIIHVNITSIVLGYSQNQGEFQSDGFSTFWRFTSVCDGAGMQERQHQQWIPRKRRSYLGLAQLSGR